MQEDRAAGRERQRVRDCVPVFWSVCSFFLRLLCVHVCVCARECVGVYVFACLHSLRVTQEETAAPILVILTPLPFLPDCPSVHIFTTRNRFPAGSKFKWATCTFTWGYSKQWADSVCVYGNINEFSPAYKRQKARLKMVRRLYCVWTNTQTKCVVDSCSAVLSIWTSKHIHKLSVCLRARTTLKSGPICFCFFSYNIVIKMRSIYVKYESSPLCKFATFMFLKISICNVHSCLSTICTPARWILASSRWQPFYMVR